MSEFIANVRAKLDTSELDQLNKLKEKTVDVKVNLTGDGADFAKTFSKQMSSLATSATNAGKNVGKSYSTALQKQIESMAKTQQTAFAEPLKNMTKAQKSYSDWWNKELNKKSNIDYGKNQQIKAFDDYISQLETRAEKASQIQKRVSQGFLEVDTSGIRKQLNKYSSNDSVILKETEESYKKLISLQKELKTGISDDGFSRTLSDKDIIGKYGQYSDVLEKVKNQIKTLANEASNIEKPFNSLDAVTASNKTLTWLKNNSKAAKDYGEILEDLADKQKKATTQGELDNLNKQVKSIQTEAASLGKTGASWTDELKRATGQIAIFTGVYGILQNVMQDIPRQMVQSVIEVDTAMTNLYKVTDETSAKYKEFLNNAGNASKALGRDVSSYIEQTATWAKLGYSMEQSAELAKVSSIYANVGEVDDETAVSDLVTTIKAFNLTSDDAMSIVDKMNKLGNEFATSSKDLGEGLSNSASALALGGMDINKSLALLTGGAEITQSAGELGNALKVGQMRIMGMKGKLEELGEESEGLESVSKIQTHILNLTKGQVNIMDSADPSSFRDYYDILKDISEVYDSLTETDRADLLETVFGKQRGNQGAAIIQAFQSGQIQKAYEATLNAQGSAQKEQDRWLESSEAKIQQFKAQFQSLSNATLDSNIFKGVIDGGTTLLTILTEIISVGNGIPALLTTIGGVSFFKNLD